MAGQRALINMEVLYNGIEMMDEVEEFTPPSVEKKTEDARGGRYIANKVEVGAEMSNWTLKVAGAPVGVKKALGRKAGEYPIVTVKATEKDEQGQRFITKYEMTGVILKCESESLKMGTKPMTNIEGYPSKYTVTENDEVLKSINIITNEHDFGDGNILQDS